MGNTEQFLDCFEAFSLRGVNVEISYNVKTRKKEENGQVQRVNMMIERHIQDHPYNVDFRTGKEDAESEQGT